jgi:hypothetical protein
MSTTTSFTFPEGTLIQPGGFLVVGQSQDPTENGGATVDVVWSDFSIDNVNGDTLSISAQDEVSDFTYVKADLVTATSIQPPTPAIDAVGNKFACPARTATFGMNGALGTPGAKNERCYPYDLSPIREDWEDISGFGTGLFSQYSYDNYLRVDLSSAPFNFFGVPRSAIWVDTNAQLAFADPLSSRWSNPTTPGSASPAGALAPFWSDLTVEASPSQVYVARIPDIGGSGGHWIIQYAHVSYYYGEDLNFEVKLFDDGTIEFHYDVMTSGSYGNYANGNAATIWMCAPDFHSALPIGIDQAVIAPNSAYRFTPVP